MDYETALEIICAVLLVSSLLMTGLATICLLRCRQYHEDFGAIYQVLAKHVMRDGYCATAKEASMLDWLVNASGGDRPFPFITFFPYDIDAKSNTPQGIKQ